MSSSEPRSAAPSVAVWYFVGATFLFAASTMLLANAGGDGIVRVLGFVAAIAGVIVLGFGFAVFRTELRRRGAEGDVPDAPNAPDAPDA